MEHGSIGYFEERRRNASRLSGLCLGVGLVFLAPIVVLRMSPLGAQVRELSVMRFGFAGAPRFIELMQVDAEPTDLSDLRDVGRLAPESGRVGRKGPRTHAAERDLGRRSKQLPGDSGDDGRDLIARAIASRGSVPVMQSSELVIETLVRPVYPDEARNRNVEGHVAVLARVDTLGNVAEAEVMTPSGESVLDVASRKAVMGCKFKPYLREGKVTEVYAVFRFAFRIY